MLNFFIFFKQVDGTGTVATQDRLKPTDKPEVIAQENGESPTNEDVVDATPFNENLFLDEDLDGLDDELNDLDLDDIDDKQHNS